jgi:hypothetical protein
MKLYNRHLLSAAIAATLIAPAAFAGIGGRSSTMIQDRGLAPASPIALEVDHEMNGMAGLRLSQYSNLRARFGHTATVSTIDASGAPVRATSAAAVSTVVGNWTFDNTTKQGVATATSPGVADTYGTADGGSNAATSAATGLHASASTAWSFAQHTSASNLAYTSDHWAANDYWQFTLSTAGFSGLTVSWDAAGSSAGPKTFQLQYSTNGTTFTPINVSGTNVSNTGTYSVATSFTSYSVDLSTISGLNNDATAAFRLVDLSPTVGGSISGGNVGATGSDKLDNFTVTAAAAVPEPSTYFGAALALVAIGWMQRRRLMALAGIA